MSAPAEAEVRISLLITTRDRRAELLATLAATVPRLSPRDEVVVFDDGSRDGSAAAVREAFPRVRLLGAVSSVGLIEARNRLHQAARGAIALVLDDDAELVTPGALDRIVEHFDGHPACAVVALRVFWGRELPAGAAAADADRPPRRVRGYVGCGHAWRQSSWRAVRPYPGWLRFYGEEEFAALELHRHGLEIHYLPAVLVHHRVVPSERAAAELAWRYRRQLRGSLIVMAMFLPPGAYLRSLVYAFGAQIRRRLLAERRWRAVGDLAWVAARLVLDAPRAARARAPLTASQWRRFRALPEAVVYWRPEPTSGGEECERR